MYKRINHTHLHKWMCPLCGSRRKDVIPIYLTEGGDNCCNNRPNVEGLLMVCKNCRGSKFFMDTPKMLDMMTTPGRYKFGTPRVVAPHNIDNYDPYSDLLYPQELRPRKRMFSGIGYAIEEIVPCKNPMMMHNNYHSYSNKHICSHEKTINAIHEYNELESKSIDHDSNDKFH